MGNLLFFLRILLVILGSGKVFDLRLKLDVEVCGEPIFWFEAVGYIVEASSSKVTVLYIFAEEFLNSQKLLNFKRVSLPLVSY